MYEADEHGDGRAVTFEKFAAAQTGGLLALATAICGDVPLAEDLVQDVLVKVFRRWDTIAELDVPAAYVRRMLVNEHLSWRRKWSRIAPSATVQPPSAEPDHAEADADSRELQAEIARLPHRQQVVLALRYYGGLSDPEIADTMGCSAGTVRGYASRALRTLRVELTERAAQLEGRTS